MPRLRDLTGQRFGRLTVIKRYGKNGNGSATWTCLCDCGNTKVVSGHDLVEGHTISCGCSRRDPRKHGMAKTRLYRIWSHMKNRCQNPNNHAYSNYGGRGIEVCKEWSDSFVCFKEWADSHGYEEELTIERVDIDKGYCPDNCTWITKSKQAQNRRRCIFVTIDGKTLNLQQWCNELGIDYKLVHNRIHKLGWEPVKALTTPVDKSKRNKKAGENHS